MKILFVITGLGVGGAEAVVVNLADELSNRGHQVCIAYLAGDAIIVPKNKSVSLVSLKLEGFFSLAAVFIRLRRLIISYRPDVVHSHMLHANLVSRIARLSVKIPRLICTAHSNFEGGAVRMLAYRLTNPLGDVFTNVSQHAVCAFEKRHAVPKGKMIPVLNGIDSRKFYPDAERRQIYRNKFGFGEKQILIAVGRLYESKDYPNLINAFLDVREKNANTKLIIVGDGPLRETLNNMVVGLGLADHVEFLGVRHDIPDLLRAADVFVLSSAWEGFALVVGEAMATEKVVVATDCGGVREVLGDDGFLVPTSDVFALSRGVHRALSLEHTQATRLGIAARKRIIQNNSIESAIERWLDIYGVKDV
ncbi:glycosyltransferase [Pseudomonas sp. RTS1]|uniref:glycosyltransferase n=1 Tax=unclassified Pseudomonas TaxID=196821 RepID=UPI002B225DB1|nr:MULTISPECIES: glycosyltransferase [unclassified Pseudomonas]MEA9990737.1 glycosyltransferase [Pseudomonas sp. RTS1]MEB0038068.1 glycosyltransferase [Pseudomonas sp. RTS2]MEB0237893.1 glycosyltransferase [Pseudomonas sp. 5S3]MEB0250721.1 glycosyltransferase [Pseudomonas sp. 5S2]